MRTEGLFDIVNDEQCARSRGALPSQAVMACHPALAERTQAAVNVNCACQNCHLLSSPAGHECAPRAVLNVLIRTHMYSRVLIAARAVPQLSRCSGHFPP